MSTTAHKHFSKIMDRAEALLQIHKDITENHRGRPTHFKLLADILRSAHVFVMASLDSYIHDLIQEKAYSVILKERGKKIPKKLLDTLKSAIPYEKVYEIFHEERPKVFIASAVRKYTAEHTYMKPYKIDEALTMLGIENIWKKVAIDFSKRMDGLKTQFKDYADRRDKIVHEGDVGRATRSRGQLRSIRRPYIEKSMKDVKRLVGLIDQIVEKDLK